METLKDKTAKGLMWGGLNSGSTQLLNLIFGIVLARILTPADYGIVGLLTIFTFIAGNLQDSGFSIALVNLKNPQDRDYNAVFWFNMSVSVSIYVILFFCAPLIAAFFQQPELTGLSRFIFLTFIVSASGIAHSAYLNKNMMNREKAIINIAALGTSGIVGITLAVLGKAYWSLAWQQMTYMVVMNVLRFHFSRWRPSLRFYFRPIRQMFAFSSKVLLTNIISSVNFHVITFIFGKHFDIKTVGFYSQANKWNTMGYSFISGMVQQVAQPVLVSVTEEKERQTRVFRKMMSFTAFLSFPALLGLALVAEEFIVALLGPEWKESAQMLRVLCVCGAFMPFYTLYQNLIISCGRSDVVMWCNLLLVVLQIGCVLLLLHFPIHVILSVFTLLTILWLIVWQMFARRLVGVRWSHTLADVCPFFLAASVSMATTYFATTWISHPVALLLVRIPMAALIYTGLLKIFHPAMLEESIGFVFRRKKKGS